MLSDGIYKGEVVHKRFHPKQHAFNYPLAMILVDVNQLESSFKTSRWWSLERFNLISFYRNDYIQPESHTNSSNKTMSITDVVAEKIFNASGEIFSGTVKLLTNPRFFGYVFNPVSFYLCYDQNNTLKYILSQINNTPWNERHTYVHQVSDQSNAKMVFEFDKAFHVSPFMPMNLNYTWKFILYNNKVDIHMALFDSGVKQFIATMRAKHSPFTAKNMLQLPIEFPLQTLRIVFRIYWHALRLWMKKVPFYEHPNSHEPKSNKTK